jgi:hypothetical protein
MNKTLMSSCSPKEMKNYEGSMCPLKNRLFSYEGMENCRFGIFCRAGIYSG